MAPTPAITSELRGEPHHRNAPPGADALTIARVGYRASPAVDPKHPGYPRGLSIVATTPLAPTTNRSTTATPTAVAVPAYRSPATTVVSWARPAAVHVYVRQTSEPDATMSERPRSRPMANGFQRSPARLLGSSAVHWIASNYLSHSTFGVTSGARRLTGIHGSRDAVPAKHTPLGVISAGVDGEELTDLAGPCSAPKPPLDPGQHRRHAAQP